MNYKNILFFVILIGSIFYHANAQTQEIDNVVGTNYMINSKILEEEREIQVYVPDSYAKSDKTYPVLYVLDGQRFYLYAVSLLQSYSEFEVTPEFIIVGIKNKYPQRFSHFSSGTQKFLDFIEKDVISMIDTKYRTSNERMLFGWEYGGGFVIHSMTEKPDLFNAYFAASPVPMNKNGSRIKAVEKLVVEHKEYDRFLYFSMSAEVPFKSYDEDTSDADYLAELLKNKAPKSFRWYYQKLVGENHRSTPYGTLYHGLKEYFSNYPELVYNRVEDFDNNGGIKFIQDYYKQRAKQYGFSPEIPNWTKFTIIRSAIRENNYTQFDAFVTQFKTNAFISGLRGNRPYAIAEFYEGHKAYNKALEIYSILTTEHPNTARPYNAIGYVYHLQKNKKKAIEYYKKAIELAKKNGDRRLKQYEKNLADIKQKSNKK